LAVGADRTGIPQIDAALTKAFAFPWHKISRTFPDGIGKASGKRFRVLLKAGGYALSAPRTTIPEQLYKHKGGRWSTLHSRPFPLHYYKRLAIEPLPLGCAGHLSGWIVANIIQPKSVGYPFSIVEV
jgi:hypothetical protein